eukprot:GGOE01061725.1.p1 GENE.GGOE01061725.1~~GGOE01061725.1.p1  ORF type:complete len:418 (+),score=71.40 GGOE01061725.1:45-1298(+)
MDARSITEIYQGLEEAKSEQIETDTAVGDIWSPKVKAADTGQNLSTEVVESLFSKGADIYRQATLIAIPTLRLGAVFSSMRRRLLRIMMALRLQKAVRGWLQRRKEQVERLVNFWTTHDVLRTVRGKRKVFDASARVPIWTLLGRQITVHSKLKIIRLLLRDYRRQFHEKWGAWEARCREAGYGPSTRARLRARQKAILQGVSFLGVELFPGGIHMAKEVDVGSYFMQLMLEQPGYSIDPADLLSVAITSRDVWRHVLALDAQHAATPAASVPSPQQSDSDAAAAIAQFEGQQRDLRLAKLVEEYKHEAAKHIEQDKQHGGREMDGDPQRQVLQQRRGTVTKRSPFGPPVTRLHKGNRHVSTKSQARTLRLPPLLKRNAPQNKVILVSLQKAPSHATNRSAGAHLAPLPLKCLSPRH